MATEMKLFRRESGDSVRNKSDVGFRLCLGLFLLLFLWQPSGQGQPTSILSPDLVLPGHLFARAVSVALDRHQHILVADAGAYHIVYFNARGVPIDTLGRRGNGPGEFQTLTRIATSPEGDWLFVLEDMPRRVHRWRLHPGLRHIDTRTFPSLPPPARWPLELWAISADTLILRFAASLIDAGFHGLYRYQWSNRQLHLLLPLRENEVIRREGRRTIFPFLARQLVAVRPPHGIVLAWSDSLQVVLHDLNGHVQARRRFRAPSPPPLTSEDWARARRLDTRFASASLPRLKRTHWPYIDDLLLDDVGNIWVRLTRGWPDEQRQSTRYLVLTPRGNLQTVDLEGPIDLEVVQNGRALGLRREPDGTRSVVVFSRIRLHQQGATQE